jgi:inosine-uridine nucleoside N-ribohydrolase
MIMRKCIVLISVLIFLAPVKADPPQADQLKRNVILDVDTSGDDLMAILFLLAQPDIDIKAITIVQGVSNVEAGAEMVLRLLALTGHDCIPVVKGSTVPLEGNNSFPVKWQPDLDHPYGLELPPQSHKASEMTAPETIISLVNRYKGNISILGLGPLTNIALALEKEPDLVNEISSIFVSDGAVYVKGAINLEYPAIHNTVSGWNLWVDAKAAGIVFRSGVKIKLIPLDLTALHSKHPVLLRSGIVRQFSDTVRGSIGRSLGVILENWIAYYQADSKIINAENQAPVWDLVAAEIFANPEICIQSEEHSLDISTGNPETAGQIIFGKKKESNVSICLKGNQNLFDAVLLRSASGIP